MSGNSAKQVQLEAIQEAYVHWSSTPLGRSLFNAEANLVGHCLESVFGYHLAQISVHPELKLFESSPIRHKFILSPVATSTQGDSILCSESHVIPLASESIDVVVVHHATDFTEQPHQIMREASRVLIHGGTLIVIGFNPWSSWGVRRYSQYFNPFVKPQVPWNAQFISPRRLQDWLTLLEFQTVDVRYTHYRPPVQRAGLLNRLEFAERLGTRSGSTLGASYVILARKQVAGVRLIRPRWDQKAKIVPIGLARPSTTRGAIKKTR